MARAITAFLVGFALAGCANAIRDAAFGPCSTYSAPSARCPVK